MKPPLEHRSHLVERLQAAQEAESRMHLVERVAQALADAPPPDAPRSAVGTPPEPPAPDATPAAPPAPAAGESEASADASPAIDAGRLEAAGLVAAAGRAARSRVLEELAVVQTQLLRGVQPAQDGAERAGNAIMFTSAKPGEGKTFCSLNVAASLARASTRPVLLVDADGKRGSLSQMLGLEQAPGLMDLAAAPDLAPQSLLRPTAVPRLFVLPYGAIQAREGQPPGARLAAAMLRLAGKLAGHVIVLDTPPCLAASDASAFAPVVGQTVMVVQAERTQRREVETALDIVDACPTIHLLLNQAQLAVNDGFGAYGGYYDG
jgi:receptor protein-tyrosine kinase